MEGQETMLVVELQKELDALRRDFEASAPPDLVATMARASAGLLISGITERVLKVGSPAPDFALPNAVGRVVSLSAATARGPAVVTFYRGGW